MSTYNYSMSIVRDLAGVAKEMSITFDEMFQPAHMPGRPAMIDSPSAN